MSVSLSVCLYHWQNYVSDLHEIHKGTFLQKAVDQAWVVWKCLSWSYFTEGCKWISVCFPHLLSDLGSFSNRDLHIMLLNRVSWKLGQGRLYFSSGPGDGVKCPVWYAVHQKLKECCIIVAVNWLSAVASVCHFEHHSVLYDMTYGNRG